MADVSFSVVAHDYASRKLREIGNAALFMAAKVNAANASMANGWERNTQAARGWFYLILYGAPLVPPLLAAIAFSAGALTSSLVSATPGVMALGAALAGLGGKYIKADLALKSAQQKVDQAAPGADKQAARKELRQTRREVFSGDFGASFRQFEQTKSAFSKFSQQAEGTTIPIANTIFGGIQKLLPKLQPIVTSFGGVFNRVLQDMVKGMDSPAFEKFLGWVETIGAQNFDNILRSFGNLGATIANLGMAFSGPGVGFTEWLERTTDKWQKWSSQLSESKGFQSFLKFARENMPLVGQLFKNLGTILGNLIKGLAPLGHLELQGLVDLTGLIAKIKPGALGAIASGIIGLVVAAKGIRTIHGIANVTTDLLGFATAVRRVRKAEEGAALGSSIAKIGKSGGGIAIIVGLMAALALAYRNGRKNSDMFRSIDDRNRRMLKAGWHNFAEFIKGVYDNIDKFNKSWHKGMMKTTDTFVSNTRKSFSNLSKIAHSWGGAFKVVSHVVLTNMAGLMTMWGKLLRALSHVPGFGWAGKAADAMFGAARKAIQLRDSIDSIHSKSVTVTTHFVTTKTTINSIINKQANDPRLQKGFAAGGPTPKNEDFIVGENGPEVLRLNVPAHVYNRQQVRSLVKDYHGAMGGDKAGSGADNAVPIEVHLHLEGKTIVQTVLAYKRNSSVNTTGIG